LNRHYRKALLNQLRGVNSLDDVRVFPADRRMADAFLRGGFEEERRCAGGCVGAAALLKGRVQQLAMAVGAHQLMKLQTTLVTDTAMRQGA
jgi:hypothetical protein